MGRTREQQWRRLRYLVNNQRSLSLPGWRVRNLASKVLAANLRRLSPDWEVVYNHPLLLVETFMDSSRFAGTSYQTAGWLRLGETQGYGRKVDLNTVALEAPRGLLERLGDLSDPRKRRGIRQRQTSILAVVACACVAGARSFVRNR